MEDTIIQWAAAAGMIIAGIVAGLLIGYFGLLIGYLIFLAAAAITLGIFD